MLCDYGCGQEAKFQMKNGKWCCNKYYVSCPSIRKKNSESGLVAQNRLEQKEKLSKAQKKSQSRQETKEKLSKSQKESWKDPKKRKNRIDGKKEAWRDPKKRKNIINAQKESWKDNQLRKENQREFMENGGAVKALNGNKNPSRPQVRMYNNTKELYPEAILNYPFKIKKGLWYSLDDAIPSLKIDIEYDDTKWWHKGKEKQDNMRDENVKILGWKVIRYKDYVPTKEQLKRDLLNLIKEE